MSLRTLTRPGAARLLCALLLLVGGGAWARGGRDREVHLPPTVEPPPPPAPTVTPLPPPGWNSGVLAGRALKETPTEVWGRTLPALPKAELATNGTQVVVTTLDGARGFGTDGRELWRQALHPIGGPVLAAAGAWIAEETGPVRAIDPATGAVVVTLSTTDAPPLAGPPAPEGEALAWVDRNGFVTHTAGWTSPSGLSASAGPAVDQGAVFIVGDAPAGAGAKLVKTSQEGTAWTADLPATAVAAPVLDATRVYVAFAPIGKLPGGIAAYTRDGVPAWRYQSAYGPSAPPAAGEGLVFLPDKDGHLYALDANDGHVRWEIEGFGPFRGRPTLIEGTLYAGNEDGSLYAIDIDDGGVIWKVSLGAAPLTGVAPVGALLVTALTNSRIVALGVP